MLAVLYMEGSFDLSTRLTQIVLEVCVSSVHPSNTEMKGDPLHLRVPFTAQTKFEQTKSVQIGVSVLGYFQGLMSKLLSI